MVFAVVLIVALVFFFLSGETVSVFEGLFLSVGTAFGVAVLVLCCGLAGVLRAA